MSASFQKTVSKILCKKIEIAIKNLESKNKKPLSNFEDGRKSLILADYAIKSIRSKKFVKINY